MSPNVPDRFWAKVDKNGPTPGHCPELGPCWTWTASLCGSGNSRYGGFYLDGRIQRAHRVAWQMGHGPIAAGLVICHRCDNKLCVRPDHLFAGTMKDNMQDAASKGLLGRREQPTHCKRGHLLAGANFRRKRCHQCWIEYQREWRARRGSPSPQELGLLRSRRKWEQQHATILWALTDLPMVAEAFGVSDTGEGRS
jgi:hypothetical protein